ncbi:MAG TPA: TatD family hydrolase [Chloroflexota bacterium]|nr:TatD family hydrolase [Chloroflexota bacterium]
MIESKSGLIDTHAHLQLDAFDADRNEVLERARENGVSCIVVPGIDVETSQAAIRLAEQEPMVRVAVGIHPSSARDFSSSSLEEIRRLAAHPSVIAIGEIGLDYLRDQAPLEVQRHAFDEQLQLATDLGLPVIVHNRSADEDVLATLTTWRLRDGANPAVLHCFAGDAVFATRAVELGLYLGFGGLVTFPREVQLARIAATIPMDRLVIETDSPYLAPQPTRGRRNEPMNVGVVAEFLARVREQELSDFITHTRENTRALFRLGKQHQTRNGG